MHHARLRVLRSIRTSPWLPRRLTARLTDPLLPVDPNSVLDPAPLDHPQVTTTFLGRRWHLDLNSHIDFHAFFDGVYDYPTVQFMRRTLRRLPSTVYLDIGANIGNHLLAVADLASRVLAFEPNPRIAERLERHVRDNALPHVEIHRVGLGDRDADLPFYDNPTNPGSASFVPDHHVHNLGEPIGTLPIRRGDEILSGLGLSSLDLVKIDVEGFEHEVIHGLRRTLGRHRPLVLFEFRGEATREKFGSVEGLAAAFPDRYLIRGLGASRRSRFLGDGSYDRPRPFDFGRNYGNLLACPEEKFGTVFPGGSGRRSG